MIYQQGSASINGFPWKFYTSSSQSITTVTSECIKLRIGNNSNIAGILFDTRGIYGRRYNMWCQFNAISNYTSNPNRLVIRTQRIHSNDFSSISASNGFYYTSPTKYDAPGEYRVSNGTLVRCSSWIGSNSIGGTFDHPCIGPGFKSLYGSSSVDTSGAEITKIWIEFG